MSLFFAAVVSAVLAFGPVLGGEESKEVVAPEDTAPRDEAMAERIDPPAPTTAPGIVPTPKPTPAVVPEGELYVFAAQIDRSLYQTFAGTLEKDVADPLTQVVNRVLVWWIDTRRDLRADDHLSVVYSRPAGREPRVHALKFVSTKLGNTYAAYAYQKAGSPHLSLYDTAGRAVELRLVDGPIREYEQITSRLKDGRGHEGVDFKTAIGTVVYAPFDATVSRRNWNTRRNGYCLDLKGPKGVHAIFLHLERVDDDIKPGVRVKKGQPLARSGNTGHSTAPHLHYQLQKGKKVLDPFDLHPTERVQLVGPDLVAFEKARAKLDAKLGES